MRLSPDEIIFNSWTFDFFGKEITVDLNMTIVGTWFVILLILIGSKLATKGFTKELKMSRWQNFVEVMVSGIKNQIEDVYQRKAGILLPLAGTLFIFILVANVSSLLPIPFYVPETGNFETYIPPTGSFSTTVAFSLIVMLCVPMFGIKKAGFFSYFKGYFEPKIFMLPFNIIGELSSGISLAIRLYGNIMSGTVIIAILLALAPIFVPVVMQLFGLLTGVIQAYIFAILAVVYISGGMGEPTQEEIDALRKAREKRLTA